MNNLKPEYSIVLGGAGFIGSHLCLRLLSEGHEVLCVDNLSTGSIDNITTMLDSTYRVLNSCLTAGIHS